MTNIGFVETPIAIANLMVELATTEKNRNVLDTGCGKGVFLEALKNKGYNNVYGIEINKTLYKNCYKKFGKRFRIILGDFLTYNFNKKFDLIIGNPPYVHFNKLPSYLADVVKGITKTAESDIYYAFIIKSISILNEGGELIYIVPYHFFYNTYAKLVRETLLKFGKIEVIIDLDEVKIFNNENPETIIFKFKKGKFNLGSEKIKILRIKKKRINISDIYIKALEALIKKSPNDLFDYKEQTHFLKSEQWSTFVFEVSNFPSVKLKDVAKVGVGLVSGFDEAFIIKDPKEILKFTDEEKQFIKKFIKGKHCNRYTTNNFTFYILLDNGISDEIELKTKYINIYQKLIPYKEKMLKRYLPKNKNWFHWQALRNYNFLKANLNKKRIYVPTLDRHPYNRFCLGKEELLPSGDVLFIQPYNDEDLYFLLGYLNSAFFRKYYLSKGGRRGGRISYTQRLLENVEIPLFRDEVKKEIIFLTKQIISKIEMNENISFYDKQLNNLIYSAIKSQKFK